MACYDACSVGAITEIPQITHNTPIRIKTIRSVKRDYFARVYSCCGFGEGCYRRLVQDGFGSCDRCCCTIIVSNGERYSVVSIIRISMAQGYACGIGSIAEIPIITCNSTIGIIAGRCIKSNTVTSIDCFCGFCEKGDRRSVQNRLSS